MALIGSMDKFNVKSDEWLVYQEQLEQFFEVNNIKDSQTEKKRVAALLSLIGADTYKVLRDLCTPGLPKEKTYEELCVMLKAHFSPATCVYRERIEFYAAQQEEGETINKWYARMHNLATNCEFGNALSLILKDKFVCALRKGKIRDRLCEENPNKITLEKLMTLALSKEAALVAEGKEVNFVRSSYKNNKRKGQQSKGASAESTNTNKGKWKCQCCGCQHTGNQKCKYTDYKCNKCGKMGHLAKVCRMSTRQEQNMVETEDLQDEENAVEIYNISFSNCNPVCKVVSINDVNVSMQIDSGAAISIITEKTYLQYFKNCKLQQSMVTLLDYSKNKIETLGCMNVKLKYSNVTTDFQMHVVKNGSQNLLGRDFLQKFNFKLKADILNVNNGLDEILSDFKELFSSSLGCYKYRIFKLTVKDDVNPIFMKPRPIPFVFKVKIENELQRLLDEGVITPIESSDWGTPLVPVLKSDGSVRICGDYKVTVNKAIINIRYPLPRIEDIFMKLNGGESFTKVDLSNAYNQIRLDEESAKLLTWSTHKGLYKLNRLPFGITPASSIFQKTLEQTLQGLNGVANFVDDIIITGKTRKEHEDNLRKVFLKLQDAGFRIKLNKCAFFQDEINYLGHTITKYGLKKNTDKIKAILEAPQPQNTTQVKSFAGLVNYYSKFVPNVSSIMKPIYQLLKKNNRFEWNHDCEVAFNQIKKIISSDNVLTHFDPELPIILSTDASYNGIAAALSHQMKNGDIRPVLFISRTLSSAESNYSVLDKEGLAVFWAVKKLHHYLLGQQFTIKTDHKPLLSLLGEKHGIPPMASSRVHRWALYLSGFDYKMEYIKGTDNNVADMLSRHPIKTAEINNESNQLNLIIAEGIPITSVRIGVETKRDPILSKVWHYAMKGWPEYIKDEVLKPYFTRRDQITCEQGCLLWGYRVIIPNKLRLQLLDELHASHLGTVKMKSIARSYFWWPKMDQEIENLSKSCVPCLRSTGDPPKSLTTPWFLPKQPGERIHIDFLGPIDNHHYLIIVDAFSKWPEIYKMASTTTEATIVRIREYCARWGIPRILVSDNGPQLVSNEFETFLKRNGIKHRTIAPYHPATNGLAENGVKNFKKGLYAALKDPKNKNTSKDVLICRYLLAYRNSKHCTTKETPAFLMIGRSLNTVFDLVKPNSEVKIETAKEARQGGSCKMLKEGDKIVARDYRDINRKEWTEATVIKVLGEKTYLVETINEKLRWKRHIEQLKIVYQEAKRNEAASKADHHETVFRRKSLSRETKTEPDKEITDTSKQPNTDERAKSTVETTFKSTGSQQVTEPSVNSKPSSDIKLTKNIPANVRPKRQIKLPAKYKD